jgi:hypothetical protein
MEFPAGLRSQTTRRPKRVKQYQTCVLFTAIVDTRALAANYIELDMRSSSVRQLSRVLSVAAILCMATLLTAAQGKDKDWRPVTPEELASKTPVVEPGADAEALIWEVRIDDSDMSDLSMKHYVRVKIFTERGREQYSKFDVPFVKGIKIKDIAARVIRPDGSTVEIKKEDIFEREIIKANGIKVRAKSFAIPNIEPGVIVEYHYKEVWSDSGASGRRLDLQRDIPVRQMAYFYKPYAGEPRYKVFNEIDTKFVKDKGGYYMVARTNVPAFKQEPNMPPDDMVRPWIRLGARSFTVMGLLNRLAVAEFIRSSGGDVKKLAQQVVAGASTDEEKLQKIYDYCQTEIANTTFDPLITDEMREKMPTVESLKDVIKHKSAEAGYIDALFAGMALGLGYDARPAFIGDRSKMFTALRNIDESFLELAAIGVKLPAGWKYFSPGNKFLRAGQLPWIRESSMAELVSEKQFQWVETPYSDFQASLTRRTGNFELHEDGSLTGTAMLEMSGQPALAYRMENYDETPEKRADMLTEDVKRQISTAEVSDVSVEGLNDPLKPLVMKYAVKIPNYAQKTGKRLFLQPGYFEYGSNPAFSSSDRKYDIFFRYPWSEQDTIEIKYPASFDLDNADAPEDVADPKNIGADRIVIRVNRPAGILHYERSFHFGGNGAVLFDSKMYPPLKGMFDAFHAADTHTLTLKQKSQ